MRVYACCCIAVTVCSCVCESSWAVGLGKGETQSAEYFGPDCSLRTLFVEITQMSVLWSRVRFYSRKCTCPHQGRCPSGDDPTTNTTVETDCTGVNGGLLGNLCHVDCSNRYAYTRTHHNLSIPPWVLTSTLRLQRDLRSPNRHVFVQRRLHRHQLWIKNRIFLRTSFLESDGTQVVYH